MSKQRWRVYHDGKAELVSHDSAGAFSVPFLGNSALALSRFGKAPTLVNSVTGLGGEQDHSRHNVFRDIVMSQWELETIYRSSWAARKAIDIPVNDMFTPGRIWTGDDTSAIDAMMEAEAELDCHTALTGAMKAGQLYGTGMLCILSTDSEPSEELDPEKVSEGSISNLLAVDRYNCGVEAWVLDTKMPRYGKPYMYQVRPRMVNNGEGLLHVHHSRVIRFDGVASVLTEGWNSLERDWGVSALNATINEIGREEAMHGGLDQLIQEASIQTMKIAGFKDAIMGRQERDDPSLQQLAAANSAAKSLFKTLFIDMEDDTQRVQVSFAGLAELVDKKAVRLASMFDIPVTRFLGVSPGGLNSTGDSDTLNYSIRLEAARERYMARDGKRLDMILARHAGLSDVPDSEWLPLMQLAPDKEAEGLERQVNGILAALEKGAILEDEARERLSMVVDWFGELKSLSDEELEDMRSIGLPPEPPGGIPGGGGNGEGGTGGSKPSAGGGGGS